MSSRIRLSLTGLLLISAALALIMYMYRPKPQAVVQVSIPPPLLVNYLVAAHAMPAGTLVREKTSQPRQSCQMTCHMGLSPMRRTCALAWVGL